MTPAHPPLPTAWNLPFQFSAGSQTSTAMSESADGFSVAATRQYGPSVVPACACALAGTLGGCPPARAASGCPPRPGPAACVRPPPFAAAPRPGPAGGVNGPAGTSSAVVIVVFGRASVFRPSHVAASVARPPASISA